MKKILSVFLLVFILLLGGCADKPKPIDKDKENLVEISYSSFGEIIRVDKIKKGELVVPEELTKDGFTFHGWYFEVEYKTAYLFETFEENATLYAKWTAIEYQVTFFVNGGSSVDDQMIAHGELLAEPEEPTKSRYDFDGWYTDVTLQEKYDFSKPVMFQLYLYAKWVDEVIPLVETNDYDAYYIITSYGENASKEVNINYHTKNTKTKVEVTKFHDTDYANKKVVTGKMSGFEAIESVEKEFERRNVVRVNLKDLEPNTQYRYRINKGDDSYTEDYYFKTASGSGPTSFLFMTDVHYYDGFDGAEISNTVIDSALQIQPDLAFLLQTGDIIDTGANSDDWHKFFTFGEKQLQKLPVHNVPGNHEHYGIGPYTSVYQNKIYSSFYNYPENGIGVYQKTSHYFIHNDTLIIQMDTDLPIGQPQQLEWLENVLKNNPAKYTIFGTHAPVNEVGNDYNRPIMNILEKYGVDLILAGHYHSESLKTTYLDAQPLNNKIGVSYFRGEGGGIKAVGTADPLDFAKGYIIDVLDNEIKIRKINARGTVLKTFTVTNKKSFAPQEATHQELMDSIVGEYDPMNGIVLLTWSEKFFKNVQKITIYEEYRDKRSIELIIPSPGYTYHFWDKFVDRYDSSYKFVVQFEDGSIHEKIVTFDLKGGVNLAVKDSTKTDVTLTFDAPATLDENIVTKYEFYVDGVLYHTTNAKSGEGFLQELTLQGLESGRDYAITFKAYGRNGFLYQDEVLAKTKAS